MELKDLLSKLKAAAEKATPEPVDTICKGGVNSVNKQIWHMRGHAAFEAQAKKDVEFYALCSPENILALCEALDEAREVMKVGAFHHDCCPWLNGEDCCCARSKVDAFLARFEDGGKG